MRWPLRRRAPWRGSRRDLAPGMGGLAMTTFGIAFQFWLDDPNARSLSDAVNSALAAAAEAIDTLP